MTPEDRHQLKLIQDLQRRVLLLEAVVNVPVPRNDFAGPYPHPPMLPDNWPQFMEPNTKITC